MSPDLFSRRIERIWYGQSAWASVLQPLAWMYRGVITVRRKAYRLGIFRCVSLPVPVIVVGNITVGGTGKTPLVLWLAQKTVELGVRPGIVSRGYGGRVQGRPRLVTLRDRADEVGDEALLLARHAGCPVCTGSDRVRAA